jgi:hypothetical protein
MRISEIEEGAWQKFKKPFTDPSRKDRWAQRLAPKPAAPAAPAAPASSGTSVSGSFVEPMKATATAKAAPSAPQAKPRMSVRAATGPVYAKGQTVNVGGVRYVWDGLMWRDPANQPATMRIAAAIDQQSRQTS